MTITAFSASHRSISGDEQNFVCDYLDEICVAERSVNSTNLPDETLAVDVIHEVGPRGTYIAHEHSYNSMKSQSQTKLLDRRSREHWMKMVQGKDMTANE